MEQQRIKICSGYKIGSLIVEGPTERRKNGYTVWRCRCDCGGEILLDTRCLQRGTVKDCGCKTKVRPGQRDISGQRFGKLTALYPTGERGRGGDLLWHCVCDCGGEIDAPLHQLTAGYRKSCGCLSHPHPEDYIGRRFGDLTVLEYAGKQNGVHRWLCRCDCGRETVVKHSNLVSGHTRSCGCMKDEVRRENLKIVDGTSVTILKALKGRTIASNTSGYTGVYRQSRSGKWAAQITFKGKTYYLGTYESIEDAVRARKRGEEMHDDFLEWYKNKQDEALPAYSAR